MDEKSSAVRIRIDAPAMLHNKCAYSPSSLSISYSSIENEYRKLKLFFINVTNSGFMALWWPKNEKKICFHAIAVSAEYPASSASVAVCSCRICWLNQSQHLWVRAIGRLLPVHIVTQPLRNCAQHADDSEDNFRQEISATRNIYHKNNTGDRHTRHTRHITNQSRVEKYNRLVDEPIVNCPCQSTRTHHIENM